MNIYQVKLMLGYNSIDNNKVIRSNEWFSNREEAMNFGNDFFKRNLEDFISSIEGFDNERTFNDCVQIVHEYQSNYSFEFYITVSSICNKEIEDSKEYKERVYDIIHTETDKYKIYQQILDISDDDSYAFDLDGTLIDSGMGMYNITRDDIYDMYHENLYKYKAGDIVCLKDCNNRSVVAVIMNDFKRLQDHDRDWVGSYCTSFEYEGVYIDSSEYFWKEIGNSYHKNIIGLYQYEVESGSLLWFFREVAIGRAKPLSREEMISLEKGLTRTDYINPETKPFQSLPTIKKLLQESK